MPEKVREDFCIESRLKICYNFENSCGGNKLFCNYCGNQVDDNAQFCSKCGKQVQGTPKEKMKVDLWLVLSVVSILLLILSISLSLSWGYTPLNQLDTEDTIPSALLGIAAIGVSGFCLYNEKNKNPAIKGTQRNLLFLLLYLSLACL